MKRAINAILSPAYWRLKILGFYSGYMLALLLALLGWREICHKSLLVACICLIPPAALSCIREGVKYQPDND